MTDNATIIDDILRTEGWPTFTNDPDDAGGPTKGGITIGTLAQWRNREVTIGDVEELTEDEARAIYTHLYLARPQFDRIEDVELRAIVVDCGVLHGVMTAARWLQEAANDERDGAGWSLLLDMPRLALDGKIGPKSLVAINRLNGDRLRQRVIAKRLRATGIIIQRGNNVKYAAGWLNRIASKIDNALNNVTEVDNGMDRKTA